MRQTPQRAGLIETAGRPRSSHPTGPRRSHVIHQAELPETGHRFKQAATRRAWSGVGPDLADMQILWIKVGPVQAVRVGQQQTVLTIWPRSGVEEAICIPA